MVQMRALPLPMIEKLCVWWRRLVECISENRLNLVSLLNLVKRNYLGWTEAE